MPQTVEAPLESALLQIGAKKNLNAMQVAKLKSTLQKVGYVESKNQPAAVQRTNTGTGPGRGEFQFELSTQGGSGAAKTAAGRVKQFENSYGKIDLSSTDRDELAKKDPDFSRISQDGQRAITLADWVMKTPGDQVGDLARGHMSEEDFWIKYHWAGPKADRSKKAVQWRREMLRYGLKHGRANP